MSHFTVTVCLDGGNDLLARACRVIASGNFDAAGRAQLLRGAAEAALAGALAPFDENTEVTPYRSYEDGGPEDHWLTRSVRRGAESWQQLRDKGAEALAAERIGRHGHAPANPEKAGAMVLEHVREWETDFADAARLGEHPSWTDVAALYNERFSEDGEEKILVDESGRAYTMSTYNPRSKWDWYVIGGRWGGRFPYRAKFADHVIPAETHWSSDHAPVPPQHCDGGPKRALDLEKMRADAAAEARERHAEYLAAVAGTPEALPWSVFTENVSEGNGYDIGQAREEYNSQPRIAALNRNEKFAFADNEDFQVPEALFTERARARAVPGWAVLTADGRWMERGQMGWWGLNDATADSSIGYWEAANAYIGSVTRQPVPLQGPSPVILRPPVA